MSNLNVTVAAVAQDELDVDVNCPYCEQMAGLVRTTPRDVEVEGIGLVEGAMFVCTGCKNLTVLHDKKLARATPEEQAEFEASDVFHDAMRLAEMDELQQVAAELAGGSEDDSLVQDLLTHLRARSVIANLGSYITPEVAHAVLALYGDEQASWPKASVAALIALIKECNASDELMLLQLRSVAEFEGYAMAVCVLMEDTDPRQKARGRHILRHLAGLTESSECDAIHADLERE